MSSWLIMTGAVLLGFGVMLLLRDLSRPRRRGSRRRRRLGAVWHSRWLAISSVLLGIALVVGGVSVGGDPGRGPSQPDRAGDATASEPIIGLRY